MRELCGKEKLPLMEIKEEDLSWMEPIKEYAYPLEKEASFVKGKMNRGNALNKVHQDVIEKFSEIIDAEPKRYDLVMKMFDDMEYNILRASILNDGVRTDGRKVTEIRPITCEVGVLPAAEIRTGNVEHYAVCPCRIPYNRCASSDVCNRQAPRNRR